MRSSCPSVASPAGTKEGRARGFPKERTTAAAWQVDAAPSCPEAVGARSGLRRDKTRWRALRAGASGVPQSTSRCRRASLHLPAPSLGQVPRTPPGEELAEPQAAGGSQKKGDKTPGGGGANLKGDRSRLLRDLRVDTKSRAAWARLLHEHPNARKYKGGNKKGLSKGCFGLKLDRIGSMSGLGC